jgi:hypothetical protein
MGSLESRRASAPRRSTKYLIDRKKYKKRPKNWHEECKKKRQEVIMFSRIINLFATWSLSGASGASPVPQILPETRVQVDGGDVGTVAALREDKDGKMRARVIFAHPVRKTWIEDVSLHRVRLAVDRSS